jgi:hypothetical protein
VRFRRDGIGGSLLVGPVLEGEFDATPLGDLLQDIDPAIYDRAKQEMAEALVWFTSDTAVTFPISAHIVTGRTVA